MPRKEKKLKELEKKIDRLSEQLHATGELVFNLHKSLLKFSGDLAEALDKSRKKDEEHERKLERRMFFRGLIMGLILGIVGNIFVSYWMEFIKGFDIPLWGWALGTATAYLGILYLIWLLERESIKKRED